MEKLENRIYTFEPEAIVHEVRESIASALVDGLEEVNLTDMPKMIVDMARYQNRAVAFNINKKFHEYCNNSGISSKEEKQKLLDDTLYYYICNNMYDEKKTEIEFLIAMLGADVNKKNEETGLSPYNYIQNSTLVSWSKRRSILKDLNNCSNIIFMETGEIIGKPVVFFDQSLDSYVNTLIERERGREQECLLI